MELLPPGEGPPPYSAIGAVIIGDPELNSASPLVSRSRSSTTREDCSNNVDVNSSAAMVNIESGFPPLNTEVASLGATGFQEYADPTVVVSVNLGMNASSPVLNSRDPSEESPFSRFCRSRTLPSYLPEDCVPDGEGPPPYELVPPSETRNPHHQRSSSQDSNAQVQDGLPSYSSAVIGSSMATNDIPGVGMPPESEGPPPYSEVSDSYYQPVIQSREEPPAYQRHGNQPHTSRAILRHTARPKLSAISEEGSSPFCSRDYDPQEGTSDAAERPGEGTVQKSEHSAHKSRHKASSLHKNSSTHKQDVEWYHYTVI